MARSNKPALYAAGVTCLGFICFAISAASIGFPIWGYYDNPIGRWEADRGYFGPWKVCKQLGYNREKCGPEVSRFRPSKAIYISGIFASVSCICLGIFCVLSIIQLAMISSREQVVMKYSSIVVVKLLLGLLAVLLAIVSAGLFAVEADDTNRSGFVVTRGISFYLQVLVIVLAVGLFVMAVYDYIFSRRAGGDPTMGGEITEGPATTFNNPGFRDGNRRTNGISMTDASGKPYSNITNGSVASMNTTTTAVSNGSTLDSVTRSPLRSSLKKPRPREGLGIQNPGFSGSNQSPTMQRNGSVKKVRIQTHSTEV